MRKSKCPSGMILRKEYTKTKGKTGCLIDQSSKRYINASIKKMKSRCKKNNRKYGFTCKKCKLFKFVR